MNAANPEYFSDDCLLRPGSTNCGGCGMSTGLTMLGRALAGERYSLVIPACCGIVTAGAYPTTSYNVPVIASTFASSPAFARSSSSRRQFGFDSWLTESSASVGISSVICHSPSIRVYNGGMQTENRAEQLTPYGGRSIHS